MSINKLAQSYSTSVTEISKASLFLKPVGLSDFVDISSDVTLDAANISALNIDTLSVDFKDDTDFTDSGYMSFRGSGTSGVSYAIKNAPATKITCWMRVKTTTGTSFSANFKIDGQTFASHSYTISTSWSWVSFNFSIPDLNKHTFEIWPTVGNVCLDKLYFTTTGTVPTGTGSASISKYTTIHIRVYNSSSNLPSVYVGKYSATSSILSTVDDWYNFDLSISPTTSKTSTQFIVACASGASSNQYVLWERGNASIGHLLSSNGGSTWTARNTSLSLNVYIDFNSTSGIPCAITTPSADLTTILLNTFDTPSLNPIFNNTVAVSDEYGGQNVTLDQSDKIFTFITDESGSMSWSDRGGVRYDLMQGIADRVNSSYGGTIGYNLFKIQSSPAFPLAIPLTTQIASNAMSDVVKQSLLTNSANFSGIRVLRKEGSYSNTPIDGEIVEDGYMKAVIDIGLTSGTEYFYTVYTYDQLNRFSKGVQISATPKQRIIPSGIVNLESTTYLGNAVQRDSNTVGIWHCSEGTGINVFDFSNSNILFSGGSGNFTWLAKSDVKTGTSGLRFDGIHNDVSSSSKSIALTNKFSFLAFVRPFSSQNEVIFSQSSGVSLNFAIVKTGLTLGIYYNGALHSASSPMTINEWNHIAVTINNGSIKFYVNGSAAGTASGASLWSASLPFNIGHLAAGVGYQSFFGSIEEISIHNVDRDSSYIASASLVSGTKDNSDRLVVLNYSVPDNYDYAGGIYRILFKPLSAPLHENDGQVILQTSASPGNYATAVPYDYTLTQTYYFRIFTQNTNGNWSDVEDSGLVAASIPDIPRDSFENDMGQTTVIGPGFGPTPSPTIEVQKAGNEKVYLKWSLPSNSQTTFVVIYRGIVKTNISGGDGTVTFPYIKDQFIIGQAIHVGTPDETEYVDRFIPNGQPQYYAIVTIDRLTQFSNLSYAKAVPFSQADDSGIPLMEVGNLHYRINDFDRIQLFFNPPITPPNSITGFFDQIVYFYASLMDYEGNPIPIDYPENFNIVANITSTSIEAIEDAFNLGVDPAIINSLPKISFHINPSGLILGTLQLSNNPVLSIVDAINFNVNITYKIGDRFQYNFPPISVSLTSPLSLTLINRDNSFVSVTCSPPPNDPQTNTDNKPIQSTKSVDGCYIRRSAPFVVRADFSFKGQPITTALVNVLTYDGTNGFNGTTGDCLETPKLNRVSSTFTLINTRINNQLSTTDILDGEGNPTGAQQQISYADMQFNIPSLPQKAALFVEVIYGGYTVVRKMNTFFLSILNMALTAAAPLPNGVDVREQFAQVWLIDPNFPNDRTHDTLVPDQTIVQWTITGPQPRPFYSLDPVPLKGVYSYTLNGTAHNVYFGPIQDLTTGETYTITASTVVQGLTAKKSEQLQISPVAGTSYDPNNPDPFAPKILMEFPLSQNAVWADGQDYAKLTISRNPLTSTTRFASCFRTCVTDKIILKPGTPISIRALGWEILYGDVVEEVDEYTGKTTLNDANASISEDEAIVPMLNADYTYVFFRTNRTITNNAHKDATFAGSCSSCQVDTIAGINSPGEIVVGSAKVVFNGQPITMVGGGGGDGIPPTVLTPVEPFAMNLIGVKANGTFVNQITIDGQTQHEVIVELIWKDGPVPNGTPVKVMGFFNGIDVSLPVGISTVAENRTDINPTGPQRSFASMILPPIAPNVSFYAGILFQADYNAVGTISRERQVAITFGFIVNQAPTITLTPSSIVSDRLDRFDVNTCNIVSLAAMNEPRSGFTLDNICGKLYAIGGTDASIIKTSAEVYDIALDTWSYLSDMHTPRVFAQSCMLNNKIYQFGGLSTNSSTGQLVVTTSAEVYDPNTDVWTQLTAMPIPVIWGVAHVVGTKIYILSGYKDTNYTFNDSILIYDTSGHSWSTISTTPGTLQEIYRVISPFSFVEGTNIYVCGGYHFESGTTGDPSNGVAATPAISIFPTTAYKFDTNTNTLSEAESNFRTPPIPRQRGVTVSFGSDHYLIAGANDTSGTLRTVELINSSSSPFTYQLSACKLIPGRAAFGATGDSCGYSSYIYVAGGVTSGRDQNFLTVNIEAIPSSVRLQGISTAALNVFVKDENGDFPSTVNVLIEGFLSISDPNSLPTLFKSDEIVVRNGKGVATLYPRSDDITPNDESPLIMQDGTLRSYTLSATASVIDSTYSGETDLPTITTQSSSSTSSSSSSTSISPVKFAEGVPVTDYKTTVIYEQAQQGGVIQSSLGGLFNFSPPALPSGNGATFTYFSDFSWIPQIQPLLTDNQATYERLTDQITRLKNNVPFGASPIFDSVVDAGTIMSFDNTGRKKLIYLLSDGDENGSNYSVDDVNTKLASIDTSNNVPLTAIYLNIIPSTMTLAKGRRVASNAMDEIAQSSGGSGIDVTSDINVSETIDTIISGGLGELGYGTYECIFDLGESSPLESAVAHFTLPTGTNGYWNISTSDDGIVYFNYADNILPNEVWLLNQREARFVKLTAVLTSTFDAFEYGADAPSLTDFSIIYNKSRTSYIYLTASPTADYAHQIAVTVDATRPQMSDVEIGATTANMHDWRYYATTSQGYVSQGGKIIIPVRRKVTTNSSIEPLDQIDSFLFSARYGAWNNFSTAAILDSSGNTVDPSNYSVSPSQGFVIFNSKQTGQYYLSVTNEMTLKVGAKIVNRLASESTLLKGAGYMWTTTKTGDVITAALVQAFNLTLLPFNPNENSVFTASYAFYDSNGRQEDTTKTEIKWFKTATPSDVYLDVLDNTLTWDNKTAKLLQPGDSVYFTVRPSNGQQFGALVKSLPSSIASDSSVRATNLQLLPTNPTPDSIFTALYDYSDVNGIPESGSQILWFKNGTLVPALNNVVTWNNAGTPSANVVTRDTIFFTVRPSNGTIFGALVRSSILTIQSS